MPTDCEQKREKKVNQDQEACETLKEAFAKNPKKRKKGKKPLIKSWCQNDLQVPYMVF